LVGGTKRGHKMKKIEVERIDTRWQYHNGEKCGRSIYPVKLSFLGYHREDFPEDIILHLLENEYRELLAKLRAIQNVRKSRGTGPVGLGFLGGE